MEGHPLIHWCRIIQSVLGIGLDADTPTKPQKKLFLADSERCTSSRRCRNYSILLSVITPKAALNRPLVHLPRLTPHTKKKIEINLESYCVRPRKLSRSWSQPRRYTMKSYPLRFQVSSSINFITGSHVCRHRVGDCDLSQRKKNSPVLHLVGAGNSNFEFRCYASTSWINHTHITK